MLAVTPFVGEGQGGLDEAPPERDPQAVVLGDVEVLHQLLGDGRAALVHLPGAQVCPGGTRHAFDVDPYVLPEAAVLHGDDRPRQVLAQGVGTDRLPVLGGLEGGYLLPVDVIDVGVLDERRVAAPEVILVAADHEEVQNADRDHGRDGQDQGDVEQDPQGPYCPAQRPPLGSLLARLEKSVHLESA